MRNKIPPLLSILLITSVLVACAGAVLKYAVLKPLGIQREENILEIPFVFFTDDVLSNDLSIQLEQYMNPTETTEPTESTESVKPMEETEPAIVETEVPVTIPETEPPTEPTEPPYVAVDASWFDDALFIGDSRTVGLKHVDALESADFFCRENMTVFTVQSWYCTDTGFRKKNLEWVLNSKDYGKIFINLGLNECCTDHDKVMTQYQEFVDWLRETEPDAVIIFQLIMTVSEKKASDPDYSLERINSLNERIKAMAVDDHFRYIDVNTWIADENGYLNEELSHDGTHLYGTGYVEWADWIVEEVGWLGM